MRRGRTIAPRCGGVRRAGGVLIWRRAISRPGFLGQIRLVLLGRSLISDGGSVTLVSGYLLDDPIPVGAGFSVANGGVEGFVRAAAPSFDRGVRINAVSPGLAEDSDEQFARFNPGRIPVRTGETIRAW